MVQELHGIPLLRMFMAILYFERNKQLATSTRVSKYLQKSIVVVNTGFRRYWEWGYLNRKPIQSNKTKHRRIDRCTWYYFITPRGYRKYLDLMRKWGDVVNSVQIPDPAGSSGTDIIDRGRAELFRPAEDLGSQGGQKSNII